MKRVFSVALTLALLGLGIAAFADKQAEKPMATTPVAQGMAMQPKAAMAHEAHVTKMSDLTWKDMEGYPVGCKNAEVYSGEGIGSGYAKFPAGTNVAPHTHPGGHWGTVISGSATLGFGTDKSKGIALAPGDYFEIPAMAVHWLNVKSDALIFISMTGAQGIAYVNPTDDPRKGQAETK